VISEKKSKRKVIIYTHNTKNKTCFLIKKGKEN